MCTARPLFAPTVRLPGDLLTSKTNKIASMLEMKSMFGGWNGHIGSAPSCFALFFFIFVFSIQLTVNKCSINFADDWIWTADLWYRKQTLYQLTHFHCLFRQCWSILFTSAISGTLLTFVYPRQRNVNVGKDTHDVNFNLFLDQYFLRFLPSQKVENWICLSINFERFFTSQKVENLMTYFDSPWLYFWECSHAKGIFNRSSSDINSFTILV